MQVTREYWNENGSVNEKAIIFFAFCLFYLKYIFACVYFATFPETCLSDYRMLANVRLMLVKRPLSRQSPYKQVT